jgi:hypothetical protein
MQFTTFIVALGLSSAALGAALDNLIPGLKLRAADAPISTSLTVAQTTVNGVEKRDLAKYIHPIKPTHLKTLLIVHSGAPAETCTCALIATSREPARTWHLLRACAVHSSESTQLASALLIMMCRQPLLPVPRQHQLGWPRPGLLVPGLLGQQLLRHFPYVLQPWHLGFQHSRAEHQ